ncbi:MAG: DUF4126 family protein [Acidobacteriota bacterium]
MGSVMSIMSAFGLAGGAGAKAFVPLLLLGGFHYTPYFELGGRFAWIASPLVMVVLGVLVILEILVDSVPELGEYADTVAYLPKIVAGFIAFAAATGSIDENLTQLGVSGVLGGGTAAGVHWVRNQIRRPFREVAESLHDGAARAASIGEAGISTAVASSAILAPPVAIFALGGFALAGFGLSKKLSGRNAACPNCGASVFRDALACPSCGSEI